MLFSCLRGDLPPASLKFFFKGANPSGVWYGTLRYVTARPATEAPVTTLYLRGRRCTAAPNGPGRTNTARTATSVALGTPFTCQPGTLRIVMWRC